MGYQESLIYIQPQSMFKAMMKTYEQAEKSGYYHLAGAEPLSVITLKQPWGNCRLARNFSGYAGIAAFIRRAAFSGSAFPTIPLSTIS